MWNLTTIALPSFQSQHLYGTNFVQRLSVVAVHGLNGDLVRTWTNSKIKAFWLRDYLPLDVSGARVLSFGYNADAAFGNTTADIIDHAKDLLSSLIDKREEADVSTYCRAYEAYTKAVNGCVVGDTEAYHFHCSFTWGYCGEAGELLFSAKGWQGTDASLHRHSVRLDLRLNTRA